MIRIDGIRMDLSDPPEALRRKAARKLGVREEELTECRLLKRSLDARKKKDIHYVCSAAASLRRGEDRLVRSGKARTYEPYTYAIPRAAAERRPVIAGFGPAGIFAALVLARAGLRPLVLERGEDADARTRKREEFLRTGKLDERTNVQFGEGGAGTFSDGKLNTGIHDPRLEFVLDEMARHGAPASVRTDARPHVGTDVLVGVVKSLREEIRALGGEVRFGTRLTGLQAEDGTLRGITMEGPDGTEESLACDHLILAVGHSARDTLEQLHRQGIAMEPKAFSMGVRIEHLQTEIDRAQYGRERGEDLPAADYSLHVHLPGGRSAYTFCMCPGGSVIAAASEAGGVVTNGMSLSSRDGTNANAALLVTLHPEDFPEPGVLGGMHWQRQIEQTAFAAGGGDYRAPAQRSGDFLSGKASAGPGHIAPSYRPGVVWTDLHMVLPERITSVLEEAIPALGQRLEGFDDPDAVLTAPETRSSSPVRILRDAGRTSVSLRGLYPCGEGAGYAGGISSAAVDGLRCAEAVLAQFAQID